MLVTISAVEPNTILLVAVLLIILVLGLAFGRSIMSAAGVQLPKKRRKKRWSNASERLEIHRQITDDH